MGLKSIAAWLNENNIRIRDGGRCGLGAVHQVLIRTTYIGQHRFNTQDHKIKTPKPESKRAVMEVPVIVSEAEFEVALRKKLRNGDGTFARDQVRAVAQRIEVVSRKEVRIRGLRSELLRTLTAASGVEVAVLGGPPYRK